MKRIKYFFVFLVLFFPLSVNGYTELPVDLTDLSIVDIQDYVDKGVFSYEDLVRVYLDRIQEYDDEYNSVLSLNENAISIAKELDEEREESGIRSLVHGIPILVKDNIDYAGMATTGGTKALSDSVPKSNAKVISYLVDNGAIILGKTNMSELALSVQNSYSSYGYVRNAYDNSYTSYGSSGGSAVSTSLMFSVASLGTDTNSSVRVPAAAAGLVGIRPTFGSVSGNGVIKYDVNRDTVGVLARNVTDNAIILDVISGGDGNKYLDDLDSSKLTIGVLSQIAEGDSSLYGNAFRATNSEILDLFNDNIDYLESLGYKIVYSDDFFTREVVDYENDSTSGKSMCNEFNKYIVNTSSSIKSFEELAKSTGRVYSLYDYVYYCGMDESFTEEKSLMELYRNYVSEFMDKNDIDVLVYPNIKSKTSLYYESVNVTSSYIIAPATGFPAITYNMGYIDGLAYSMEFLTTLGNEQILYNLLSNLKNNYVLSSEAPMLYEVSDEVTELVNYYMNVNLKSLYKYNKDALETYNNALDNILYFFDNYDDVEDKETTAINLLNDYKEAIQILKEAKSERNTTIFLVIMLILFLVLIVLLKLLVYSVKKNKRNKH